MKRLKVKAAAPGPALAPRDPESSKGDPATEILPPGGQPPAGDEALGVAGAASLDELAGKKPEAVHPPPGLPEGGAPTVSGPFDRCHLCGASTSTAMHPEAAMRTHYRKAHPGEKHPGWGRAPRQPRAPREPGAEAPVQFPSPLDAYPPHLRPKVEEGIRRFFTRITTVPFRAAKLFTGSKAFELAEEEKKALQEDGEFFALAFGLEVNPKIAAVGNLVEDYSLVGGRSWRDYVEERRAKAEAALKPEEDEP